MQARFKSGLVPTATLLVALVGPLAAGCSAADPPPASSPVAATPHCLPNSQGFLRAQVRGALVADLDWHDAQIHCEGGTRPDGSGVRVSIVGPWPDSAGLPAGRKLRFVFGIDADAATLDGSALPTNLTLIVEGDAAPGGESPTLYATRGDDKCTTDRLQRQAIDGKPRSFRVDARGFCVSPASTLDGNARLLIATFDFAAQITLETP
jgi:hypothetical protein